jgi:o-succinylbenzoate synthase
MALRTIELWRGGIDLISPFRTSFGTDTSRDLLYVHAVGDSNSGWGECVAGVEPNYSSEYLENCVEVISRFLVPLINRCTTAESFIKSATPIRGNYMSKACVEAALLDVQLRDQNISMAKFLGATKYKTALTIWFVSWVSTSRRAT